MKKQRFYPRQVLRALEGSHDDLTDAQWAAVTYLTRRARKLGLTVLVGPETIGGKPQEAVGRISVRIFANDGSRSGFKSISELKDED